VSAAEAAWAQQQLDKIDIASESAAAAATGSSSTRTSAIAEPL
jgi:hypothetical protein